MMQGTLEAILFPSHPDGAGRLSVHRTLSRGAGFRKSVIFDDDFFLFW